MSSIVRPTAAQKTRRLIVLATTLFAIAVNYGINAFGWGQSPAEFSADSDETLRVASYAFSIWGAIFLGLLIYAVRQVLPQTGESDLIRRMGWPSVLALLGVGWWTVAAAWDAEAATVVIIFATLAVLLVPLLRNAAGIRTLDRFARDRLTVVWPLAALAGWLTVAAPVNLLTVLTGNGDLPASPSPTVWALIAVGAVTLAALAVTERLRTLAYGLPIAWGLVGAFVAEQERNPTLAFSALGAAAVVLVGAVILTFGLKRGVERAHG
ncbi:MAG TPA: hypothetical protein VGR32_08165 [Brevundimonas sp.]|jgi:hypothetical protein|uniref:hypothetical protein n=1 Tax=Brevundimonas sp. TaxID=1871086 RepID=UPI002DE320E3|nr:hypothetical protein [Brevundimonas sp.]